MSKKRICLTVLLSFLCISFLSAQSLVELAQKEKERRESLKGKKGVVVTNASLAKVKKVPAVSVSPAPVAEDEEPAETPPPPPQAEQETPLPPAETPGEEVSVDIAALEEKAQRAEEYVALLSLKMNGLWQEFYSLDDMTSRDAIQQEISTTYLQLQKAQQDAEKALNELEEARSRRR